VRRAEGPPQRARERALLTPREPAGLRHGKAAGLHRPSRQRRRTLQSKQQPRDGAGPLGGLARRRPTVPAMNPRPAAPLSRIAPLGRTPARVAAMPSRSGRRRRRPRRPLRRQEAKGPAGTRSSARKGPLPSRSQRHARLPSHDTASGAGRPDPRRACGCPRTLAIPGALRRAEPRRRSGIDRPGREGFRSSDAFAYRYESCLDRAKRATVKLRAHAESCE